MSTIYIFLYVLTGSFFIGWWGSGRLIHMEFSIEAFKQAPSREVLESCRKTDLFLIADFYDISLSKTAKEM